jgi:hypothetical protein
MINCSSKTIPPRTNSPPFSSTFICVPSTHLILKNEYLSCAVPVEGTRLNEYAHLNNQILSEIKRNPFSAEGGKTGFQLASTASKPVTRRALCDYATIRLETIRPSTRIVTPPPAPNSPPGWRDRCRKTVPPPPRITWPAAPHPNQCAGRKPSPRPAPPSPR